MSLNNLEYFVLYRQLTISKSGNIADGIKHMEKAISLDPSCVQAYNLLVTYEMQK